MHITGDDPTGSLIKLSSKSTNVTNGILRMDTNYVRSGKLVSIEANKLEDGSAIDISNDGSSLSTGSLLKLTSNVKGDNNGANGLVKIVANDMTDGKGIVLEGKNLRKGTGIEITNNAHLTSGKLLHMKTSSSYAQNPVAVEASEMTNGVIMKIEGDSLTSLGLDLLWTTNQGSSMVSSMSSQNIESIVSNDGRFLVNANVASSLHVHDQITLENCDHGKNTHIDTFMITQITKNVTSKYTCAVDCKPTTSSSTTTSAPQVSTTTANASTTTNASTGVTSTASPSNATTISAASVATTTTAPSAYICSSIDDCEASIRGAVSFVKTLQTVQEPAVPYASIIRTDTLMYHLLMVVRH